MINTSKAAGALPAFVASGGARVVRALTRVGTLVVVARLFPLSEVGQFAFLFGAGTITAGVSDLGVTALLQRDISKGHWAGGQVALERVALQLRLWTIPVSVLGSWALSAAIAGPLVAADLGTLVFATSLVVADFLGGMRRARGEFQREASEMASGLSGASAALLVAWAFDMSFGGLQVLLGLFGAMAIGVRVVLLAREWQSVHERSHVTDADAADPTLTILLRRTRWFWLMSVGSLLLFELPIVVLRSLGTEEQVALFAAAMRAVGLASQPFVVLGGIFVPALAWMHHRSDPAYRELALRLNGIHVVAFPAALAAAVLGGTVLLRGFGAEYMEAGNLLWILGAGTLAYLGAPSSGIPVVEGRERELAIVSLLSCALMVLAAHLLVPGFGLTGAAVATALAYLVAKAGHAVLYRSGSPRRLASEDWVSVSLVGCWMGASYILPASWRWTVLVAGAALSTAVTFRRLRETRLTFRSRA